MQLYIYIYIYTYIYIYNTVSWCCSVSDNKLITFGWQYLSDATSCLIRPRWLYASFFVTRTIVIRCIIRHVWRKPASDKSR